MNRFPQTIYRSIQRDKQKHIKASKLFNTILGEQPGNFLKILLGITFNHLTNFHKLYTDRFIPASGTKQ
jgi:hypothetical protein